MNLRFPVALLSVLMVAGCGQSAATPAPTATSTSTPPVAAGSVAEGEAPADAGEAAAGAGNPVTLAKRIPGCELPAGITTGSMNPDGSREAKCDVFRSAEEKRILAGTQVAITTYGYPVTPGMITIPPDDFHQVVIVNDANAIVTIIGMSASNGAPEFGITGAQVAKHLGGTVVPAQG